MVEDFLNDMFKIGEEAIDRVSRRRSIELTAQPNKWIVEFPCKMERAYLVWWQLKKVDPLFCNYQLTLFRLLRCREYRFLRSFHYLFQMKRLR